MGSNYCIHKWTFSMYKKMIAILIARFVQDFCWNYYMTAIYTLCDSTWEKGPYRAYNDFSI